MNRLTRIFAALLTLATMLFAQLAVAAHPCPGMAKVIAAETMAADEVLPCHEQAGTKAESKALCKQHCTDNQRTVADAFAQLPITFVATFAVPLASDEETSSAKLRAPDAGLVHTLGPPLAIAHCCLRI